jgi:cytochrome c-type biogenesis protein CcmH
MRQMVRERLLAGDTDNEVYAFMVDAFGQSILASPPTSGFGLAVWVVPPIGLLFGTLVVALFIRRLQQKPSQHSMVPIATETPKTSDALGTYLHLVDIEMQEGPTRG